MFDISPPFRQGGRTFRRCTSEAANGTTLVFCVDISVFATFAKDIDNDEHAIQMADKVYPALMNPVWLPLMLKGGRRSIYVRDLGQGRYEWHDYAAA